jgi:hypothetical protein
MTEPTAVRIDGGQPVHEHHQLAVFAAEPGDMVVICVGCGAELDVDWEDQPIVAGTQRGLTVADLIWLAVEHRGQIATEEATHT